MRLGPSSVSSVTPRLSSPAGGDNDDNYHLGFLRALKMLIELKL